MRIDKWLWAARFYKTRSLASEALGLDRVHVNGAAAKASREVRLGDQIDVRQGPVTRSVWVRGLSTARGSATVAATLFEELPESIARREQAAEQRRLAPEPAHAFTQGRPTKRDRRTLDGYRSGGDALGWGDRWSASQDD